MLGERAVAQPTPGRAPRIGLFAGSEASLLDAFAGELKKLGYVDGDNLVVEQRIVEQPGGPALARQAGELARLDLKLVVAGALPMALAMRAADPAVPMVIATCPGIVSNGFASSMRRPGGHVTGIDELPPGVTGKRLSLLKAAAPQLSRVGLLSTTPGRGGHETQLADAEATARRLTVSVTPYRAATPIELQSALQQMVADGMQGFVTFQGGLAFVFRKQITDFAAAHRLPAIHQATVFPEAGGLMAWAPDINEQYRMAARDVSRILKGADPGEIPIVYPPRYYLILNRSAARDLGLEFPRTLLAQADRILP
jgi:putative ABC transport system substrate-binding protein